MQQVATEIGEDLRFNCTRRSAREKAAMKLLPYCTELVERTTGNAVADWMGNAFRSGPKNKEFFNACEAIKSAARRRQANAVQAAINANREANRQLERRRRGKHVIPNPTERELQDAHALIVQPRRDAVINTGWRGIIRAMIVAPPGGNAARNQC